MEEEDIDRLFEPPEEEEEEGDPSNVKLPPSSSSSLAQAGKSAKKKARTTSVAEELKKIPSEKGKMQKLAEMAAKNAPPPPPPSAKQTTIAVTATSAKEKKKTVPSPSAKQTTTAATAPPAASTSAKKAPSSSQKQKVKGGVIETGDGDKVIPLFPHAGDLQRLEMMLFRTVESAWRAQLPDSDERKTVDDELSHGVHAEAFNMRCAAFSRQLKLALVTFFTDHKNTAMANVVDQMPKCILTIFPQPKFLHPDKPAVCIWSGKIVAESSLVRSIALIPKKAEHKNMAASFHMHRDFIPILKAIYTTMFFACVISEKQVSNFAKISPALSDWKQYFPGWLDTSIDPGQVEAARRESPVAHFVNSAKSQLVMCIELLRKFLPQETFIVKTE